MEAKSGAGTEVAEVEAAVAVTKIEMAIGARSSTMMGKFNDLRLQRQAERRKPFSEGL